MGLLFVLLLFSSATLSFSDPCFEPRLQRKLSPFHYRLFIQPYIFEWAFDGKVSIQMNVLNETNLIMVHADGLNISSTKVFINETSVLITRIQTYEPNKYLCVYLGPLMRVGDTVKLDLEFRGRLHYLIGISKTGFYDAATNTYRPMVVTSFRPNCTRMGFPNFDEPFFKSRFTIILRHWPNLTAVSNMPEWKVEDIDSDWRETEFKKTPLISSFAVGFVLSGHSFRNDTLPDGRPHRVWTVSERVDKVSYTLNVTSIAQGFLNREIGNISSLPKIDHVAIPYTFNRGGNGHWGLINDNVARISFDSTLSGDENKQSTVAILATELARNYFGLLVSCQQWNHVWLDTGLSRFYGLKAAAAVEPVTFEENEIRERGLYDDALNNSRPLVTPENDTRTEPGIHNLLIQSKASALMKMMEDFIGARAFKRGIRRYMYAYAFKSVVTPNLFETLQGVAGASMNITEIMNTWVYSMGYPVINIQLLADNKINATQKRFLMDPLADANSPPSADGYKWYVPLNYRTKGGQTGRVWLNKTDAVFENLLTADDNWILFNYNQSAFYRVNYEATLWNNIATQLETDHMVFTDLQRSQLLSDALTLAQAEQLGFDVALKLTMYAWKERSLLSWTPIDKALATIHPMIANTSDFAYYQRYVLNLTTNAMNELTVSDEGTLEKKLLRQKIMPLSCSAGHSGCTNGTTQLFNTWIQNNLMNDIPINIRSIVICQGIAHSTTESDWNTTFSRFYEINRYSKERPILMSGLACTRDLTLVDRLIDTCTSNDTRNILRYSDLERAIIGFSANPAAIGRIWEWLKVNHRTLETRFYSGAYADFAKEVTFNFNTRAQLQEVQHFFTGLASSDIVEAVKKLIEKRINANILWMDRHHATVSLWLQQNYPMPTQE